jgi:GH24 family phage-related lysozyme (muramidase)
MDSEGFSDELYDDPAGHCTIGFGHLVHKGKCNGTDATELKYAMGIGRQEGETLLRQDVQRFAQLVNRTVLVPLTQAQFDALVDFAYNVGFKAFRSSTLLNKLNAGDYAAVPAQLRRFVKAGGVEQAGLVRRRAREAEMFASGLEAVQGPAGAGRR